MGLDMYLNARQYIRSVSSYETMERSPEHLTILTLSGLEGFKESHKYGAYVSVCAAYWRKANAIHQWFVDNVQNGEDDCNEYGVSIESMRELIKDCQTVLSDMSQAEDILAPQAGFFFGGTEIDAFYVETLDYTVERLSALIELSEAEAAKGNYVNFTYQSSW